MTYDGVTYYYITNPMGDVTGIANESGIQLVYYYYTAYGTAYASYNTAYQALGATLSGVNSLFYRGYVYDRETGLYYLQSRYYNPKVGRFINADAFTSTGQGLLGNNMFAYCGNNPIIYIDRLGTRYTRGEIHNLVVDDICRVDPNKTRKKPKIIYIEMYFGHEYGYCDVYDIKTHEVWEVKRINGGASCAVTAAKQQLENYVYNGILKEHAEWKMQVGGTQTTISGNCFAVRDKDGKGTYIIGYWDISNYSPVKGVIFYDYIYIPDPEEAVNTIGAFLGIGIGLYVYTNFDADSVRLGNPAYA